MSRSNRNGLSLVEVIVILAVMTVTLALLLPALRAAQIAARRATCVNHLKMIGLSCHNYEAAWGTLPMSRVDIPEARPGPHGIGHSGFTALLSFMEHQPVYNAYNFSLENWHAANATVTRTRIDAFLCPDNGSGLDPIAAPAVLTLDGKGYPGQSLFAPNHYAFNWGGGHEGFGDDFAKRKGTYLGLVMTVVTAEGRKAGARNVRFEDVLDGTSLTLLAAEKRDGAGWAVGGFAGSEFDVNTTTNYQGDDAKAARVFTGSFHPDGLINVLLADGSVRTLSPTIEKPVWYALMTRAGGEEIDPKDLRR